MDYEYYVNRRPPSPPPLHSKLRPYTATPSLSSASPHPLLSDTVFDIQSHLKYPQYSQHPQYHQRSTNNEASTLPRQNVVATKMPTLLNRRAVCDEYITLASTVANSVETETLRDRQEVVRIRLEHMLTEGDARTSRVLFLALQKCNVKLDELAAATRHVDEARTRMRVIESKYFHGTKATDIVAPELRNLHIRRGALATMVEHIQCTLHDQVRIHYLLTELAHKLANLQTVLHMFDRGDRLSSSSSKRSDRMDDLTIITSVPKQQTSYHRQTNGSHTHQRSTGRGRESASHGSHPRSSFSGDTLRRAGFNRRVSRSYAFRQHSQDHSGTSSPDRGSRGRTDLRTQRSLSRGSDTGLIPLAMKRALSYNSVANSAPSGCPDSGSLWEERSDVQFEGQGGQTETPSSVNSSPGKRTGGTRGNGRLSFGNVHARFLGDRERSGDSGSGKSLSSAVYGRGEGRAWRRRVGRVCDDGDSVDDESLHVSPVSYSTGSEKGGGVNGNGSVCANWSGRLGSEPSIMLDIDSLCTEASSMLSCSRGMDGEKGRRRGSLSSGLRHEVLGGMDENLVVKGLPKFGFGRMRAQSQMKKLWTEINELYSIVLTHGPHLVEEKIVARSSVETGLLGSWNAGKGQGLHLRVNFQTGVVTEAVRKADGIMKWQHRLVVAIRRDFYEQRSALNEADRVISAAYLTSLDLDDEKFHKA